MIEVKVNEPNHRGLVLAVDGITWSPSDGIIGESRAELQSDSEGGDTFYVVLVNRGELSNRIAGHRFSDISREIKSISIIPSLNLIEGEAEISHGLAVRRDYVGIRGGYVGQTYMGVTFLFDADGWHRLWSIRDYQEEFRHVFEQQNLADLSWTPEESLGFGYIGDTENITSISAAVKDTGATIEEEARSHAGTLRELHRLTVASLMSRVGQESVVTHFNFPDEVRVACEQYLLYFVQFLEDLGVRATAELHHEAGEVLFAVTPEDKDEALDKIRDALGTYLSLAASPVDTASVLQSEIEVQRLAANIQHLQGQLTLAHAVLQSKDATIQLQQATINLQRRMLGGEVMLESVKDVTPKPKGEETLGGLVEITDIELKGVTLKLSEVFRRLRKKFGKKE